MEDDVEPATDTEFGRVLPRLQAIAMIEIMQWFPVIEGLIAVLYWCISCSQNMGEKADVESCIQRDVESRLRGSW
jgi:hypothetical protein